MVMVSVPPMVPSWSRVAQLLSLPSPGWAGFPDHTSPPSLEWKSGVWTCRSRSWGPLLQASVTVTGGPTERSTVHCWDAVHASGANFHIDAAIALDGVDEFLGEFGSRAADRLKGSGETYQFVVEELGPAFTVTAEPERLMLHSQREPDVVARCSAATLLLFLWGRATPDDLDVSGDGRLLDRWHELVRI